MNKELNLILEEIKTIAKEKGKHPNDVSKPELLNSGNISEWTLRKLGGLANIKNVHFPWTDKDLVEIKKLKDTQKYIKSLEAQLTEKKFTEESVLNVIKTAISDVKPSKFKVKIPVKNKKNRMTMELMISDVHFGKKSDTFDLKVCRDRLQQLTTVFLEELKDSQKNFNVHRIIVALLGDIIESYTMHGIESSLSSEFSNTEQIKEAIESLFYDVIVPIAQTGILVDIPAVSGNHDRWEKGRTMQDPGLNNLTWIIYNAIDLLIKQSGFKNVKMVIPKHSYCLLNIYDNTVLYEHLDNVKAPTKDAFEKLIQKRSIQLNKVIDFLRGGHWHEYFCYGRGRTIVNECVPGQDSYARVMGFDTQAGQTINFYIECDLDKRPSCFYKSFPVYLK